MGLLQDVLFYIALIIGVFVFFKLSPRIPILNRLLMAIAVVVILFIIFFFVSVLLSLIIVLVAIIFLISFLGNRNTFRLRKRR